MLFTFLRMIAVGIVLAALGAPLDAVKAAEPGGVADRYTVKLESPWVSMTTGGAGRYLVLHLKDAKKLALLDVAAGDVTHMIDAPGEDLMLAGGIDKLVVLVPSQKLFHRYDIATLKREKSFPAPADFQPKKMAMGNASQGPIVCHTHGPITLFDLQTLKPITPQGEVLTSGRFGDWGYEITVSGDGQTIVGWIPGITGQQYSAMKLNGAAITKSPDGYSYAGRYLMPSADGSLFFRDGVELFDADLHPLSSGHLAGHVILPGDDPNYFLALKETDDKKKVNAWICASGTLQKIVLIQDVGNVLEDRRNTDKGHWKFAPRVRWLPTASTLVSLPANQDEVLLVHADLKESLEELGDDYLHIVSSPPRQAWLGERYSYQLDILTNGAKVDFEVASAPDGLKISRSGQIEWTPKTKPVGGIEQVVIAVSAGDQQAFHSFAISVDRKGRGTARAIASQPRMERPAPERPSPIPTPTPSPGPAPAPIPAPAERLAESEPVKIDDARLEIPPGEFLLTPGANARNHLLLQGNRLTVLAADGITPEKTVTFKRPYVRIADREGYYVAVSKEPFAVEQIDKQTLEVTKSVKFTTREITDLVLHPQRPLAYVAHMSEAEFPHYRFLVYDETKGEGRASEKYLGTFLAIDPGGRYLMAGYRDIYEQGSKLLFNPGRIHVVPDYGSVDWLVRYDLDRQGLPQGSEMHDKAGGNGKGIRLSPDGKQVSYLSVVGSPRFSGQLCAWDVNDFEKLPTTFAIKDKATTEELAYHPFLSWVVCQGKQGDALLFDCKSGDLIADKVATFDLAGAKVHGLAFAADGKGIVLDTSVNDIHYLHRVALKLSSLEQQACNDGYQQLSAAASAGARLTSSTPSAAGKAPLAGLQALRGGAGAKMTAKDVAQQFTDAVVVIETEDNGGTGMLVGADGYVLTCAHCIAGADTIRVSYRRSVAGEIKRVTAEASLVNEDEARDLALLKIEVPSPLPTIRLGASAGLVSGERTFVIGNPGVGSTTLDYTITEGIISSVARQIDENTYIQTSASINPGSSGGPLFNEHGLVVGQVMLKAKIEGAGFALPSDALIRFLVDSVDPAGGLKLQRQWVDASGAHRVDATLEKITAAGVVLRKANGAEVVVPLQGLSAADRSLVEQLQSRLP